MTKPAGLNLAAEPPPTREVSLGAGVVATLKPWSGLDACTLDYMLALDAERVTTGDLSPWGLSEAQRAELVDTAHAAGFSTIIATAARAALRITAWNVLGDDGEPERIDRFTLARLFTVGVTGESGAEHLQAYADAEAC